MRIFISYSSRYRDLCERLQLALEAGGRHQVFVDRSELAPAQPFDDKLRRGVADCDLLIFLVSPESVAPGCYALTELGFAQARWRHPAGRVLPVKVAPTPTEAMPAYLRAVTILEPQGDVVAETVAAVNGLAPPGRRSRALAALAVAVLVLAALGGWAYTHWQAQRAEAAQVATLATAARQLCESGDPALAWQRFDAAIASHPAQPALRQGREDCGMRWLRDIHVQEGKETFTDVVNRVLPALAEGLAAASGQRAADLHAHMGWADFLRIREGASGLDPAAHYAQALAAEPSNVFAHAMWGHYVMVLNGPIDDAKRHFAQALASGRERPYVRGMQVAAMLYHHEAPGQIEAAQVMNDMRKQGEPVSADTRERLWTYVYADALSSADRRAAFLAALHDPDDAATFLWLFPESAMTEYRRVPWRFYMASLEEASGQRAAALARYEALRADLRDSKVWGSVFDDTVAAIKRLR